MPVMPTVRLKPEDFRASASEAHRLVTGIKRMSESKKKALATLRKKILDGKDITPEENNKLLELEAEEKQPPQLSKGGKTYVEEWVKDFIIYVKKHVIGNKYTEHGLKNECITKENIEKYWDIEVQTCVDRLYNEWCEGEFDFMVIEALTIIDAKNSYTHRTFPIFDLELENFAYYVQMQVYMFLTGCRRALVVYNLTDHDKDSVEYLAEKESYRRGLYELNKEVYDEIENLYTYSNLHTDTTIRAFEVFYDEDVIEELKLMVELGREYAKELIADFKNSLEHQKKLFDPKYLLSVNLLENETL